MPWNNTTKQYEFETESEILSRLLDNWNTFNNSTLTLNQITGSGLEAAFYTYISLNLFLQTGISDLEAKMTFFYQTEKAKLERPTVVIDNIKAYAKEQGIDLIVYDLNSVKLTGQPDGVYWVFKTQPTPELFEKLFKKCVVAGVIMRGSVTQDIILSTGQEVVGKYTVATELSNFRIRLQVKKRIASLEPQTTTDVLRNAVVKFYQDNYVIGADYNTVLLGKYLIEQFLDIYDIIYFHSLDGGNTWLAGSYLIPYNNFIDITTSKVVVEII